MRASLLLAACLGLATAPTGRAIVIYGGTGSENTTDPGGGLPWAHVGSLNGATGVYLGLYGGVPWALTAAHVGAGTLTLESGAFAAGGSAIVIRNPDNSPTDLAAFPLSTTPTLLPNLSLASAAPAAGTTIFLIGNGRQESGSLLHWSVTVDPSGPGSTDTLTAPPNATGPTHSGYALGAAGKRWGEALYTGTFLRELGGVQQSFVETAFVPEFRSSQAAVGDSGGAIFVQSGASWSLLGIVSAVSTLDGQPNGTAVTFHEGFLSGSAPYPAFNQTLGVSLPVYQSALLAAIPEPGHYALGAGALSLLAVLWHRHRSQGRR